MNQDLLAPPRLAVRTYAKMVAGVALLAIVVGVVLAVAGTITFAELVGRVALIAILSVLAIWAYHALTIAAKRAAPERMPLIHAAVVFVGFSAFYGSLALILRGTSFGLGSQFMFMVPMMVGMTLVSGGWGRRVGNSMHCPKCEYEFRFDDHPNAPKHCPECGSAWLGQLNKGRRVRSPRMIAAGIGVAFFGMVVLNPVFYLRSLAPHLPTPMLYAILYVAPKSAYTSWDELATRPLDSRWTRVMAERVLRHRASDQYDSGPSQWFESMAARGSITSDLVDRFHREGFRAELMVPARVKVGEAFTVKLRVHHVAATRSCTGLMFAGFAIGDEVPRRGRQTQPVWALELRPEAFWRHRDVLQQKFTSEHVGEIRVRVVYWVVNQPSFWNELTWQPDGTPVQPSKATWFERVEIEKTIHVE